MKMWGKLTLKLLKSNNHLGTCDDQSPLVPINFANSMVPTSTPQGKLRGSMVYASAYLTDLRPMPATTCFHWYTMPQC